jgi:hypothetical protein
MSKRFVSDSMVYSYVLLPGAARIALEEACFQNLNYAQKFNYLLEKNGPYFAPYNNFFFAFLNFAKPYLEKS